MFYPNTQGDASVTDDRKFRALLVTVTLLILSMFTYNLLEEYLLTDFVEYVKRRAYYESVIRKKGLDLRDARHWRKKD